LKISLNILKHQLPALAWAIFIMVLCTTSTSNDSFVNQELLGIETDKWGHAFIFAVLVFFIMLGLIKTWRFSFLLVKIRIISVIIAILYGVVVELVQHFYTVDRTGDFNDFIADIIGSFCGWLMFYSVYGNLKFLDK
jgi:di/tricarboxylate transporter